jgi:hypothetical protein
MQSDKNPEVLYMLGNTNPNETLYFQASDDNVRNVLPLIDPSMG